MDMMEHLKKMARAAGKEHLLTGPPPEVSVEAALAEDALRLRIARREAFRNSLPDLYTGMTFEAWLDRGPLQGAYERVREWAESYPMNEAGLFLYSTERGTGKTHLAIACGLALADKGYRVQLVDVVALLNRIRNGFEDKHPRIDVERIGRAGDVLILDDLGAEKQSPWVSEQLYLLINTAIACEATLIVTSNLDFGGLAERMDDRVVSRIIGATDVVLMDAPDFRLEQHKKRRRS